MPIEFIDQVHELQSTAVNQKIAECSIFQVEVEGKPQVNGFKAVGLLWTVFHGIFGVSTYHKAIKCEMDDKELAKLCVDDPGVCDIAFRFRGTGGQWYPLITPTPDGHRWCFKPRLIDPKRDLTVWQPLFDSVKLLNSLAPRDWKFSSKAEAADFINKTVCSLKIYSGKLVPGEPVVAFCYDSGDWNDLKIRPGVLVSIDGTDVCIRLGMRNGNEFKVGACGGPIFYANGEVIAMHHLLINDSNPKGYAIRLLPEMANSDIDLNGQSSGSIGAPSWHGPYLAAYNA